MFLTNVVAASHFTPHRIRGQLLRLSGIKSKTNKINSKCFFNSKHVSIGEGSFINNYCKFFSSDFTGGTIEIGSNCFVAMDVIFTTMTHDIGHVKQRAGEGKYCPIKVGNGCWIGTKSILLPGITICEGCIIAAGSVVNKDCEPNGLYAGVPAKRIKDLPIKENEQVVA